MKKISILENTTIMRLLKIYSILKPKQAAVFGRKMLEIFQEKLQNSRSVVLDDVHRSIVNFYVKTQQPREAINYWQTYNIAPHVAISF